MMSRIYLSVFCFICLGCSRPFTITAKVNGIMWYGTGLASKIDPEKTGSCAEARFGVSAITDIPYVTGGSGKASGCASDCTPTQLIDFFQLPLARGKYDLTLPDPCLPRKAGKVRLAHLKTDPAGPHIIKGKSLSIVDDFDNVLAGSWIRVGKVSDEFVKGKFSVTLTNSQGDTLKVKRGKFKGTL